MTDALLVVLDLVLVIAAARGGGVIAVRLGEPRIAGVLLVGPTVLGGQIAGVVDGAVGGGLAGTLFPPLGVDVLTWVGALGMMLYMLLVGLTIDPAPMARRVPRRAPVRTRRRCHRDPASRRPRAATTTRPPPAAPSRR